jgi:bacillithiol biosynthesis deacetylase BshB1
MDLLAIGAHPDDCELFCGGLLALMARQGYKTAICDLTRGEAASRGTPEERAAEAARASEILSLDQRISLDLGDAGLENTRESRQAVVEVLRRLRPRAVATFYPDDRHPDHIRAHHLVREACFYAGVGNFGASGERLAKRPELFYFIGNARNGMASHDFIVPIDDVFETKQRAIAAYASQFYNPSYIGPKTMISSPDFIESLEARARVFGQSAGAKYGEPFALDRSPAIANPLRQLFGIVPGGKA